MNLHDRPLIEQMAVAYATEIERLNAEIARLRAALEAQLEAHNYAEVLEIARKALANQCHIPIGNEIWDEDA